MATNYSVNNELIMIRKEWAMALFKILITKTYTLLHSYVFYVHHEEENS